MRFYADLHIHSKYSRATSKNLDLENLALWGRKKGVTVLATGDFTHPVWLEDIREKLVPAEPGLFRLRPDLERWVEEQLDGPVSGEPVRFMLEVEISTIYKKDDKTRKVHHLLYASSIDEVEKINAALGRIGNLKSDGRPILGLDSRDLLEITLEGGEGCYLIPAHIWTPWFAALGSQSGFDSIDHCYGDLTSHIFALETGLSSDPEMNRRLSMLDRYALVSNSDAHSPSKVGREACAFETDLDYFAMRRALETGEGYEGTVEFFPEEGKYHMDGHRKCGVRWTPEQSKAADNICPACGKRLTLGVMHRVDSLADRPENEPSPVTDQFASFIPLEEVISEIEGRGPKTKTVQGKYESLIGKLGSELFILDQADPNDLRKAGSTLLAEALTRMRQGQVIREAGYDGEYGVIRLFNKDELSRKGGVLFDVAPLESKADEIKPPAAATKKTSDAPKVPRVEPEEKTAEPGGPVKLLDALDDEQRAAAQIADGPLLIVAGPGTGKTRTLTHRLAHLVLEQGADPNQCLAITFTRRAADEMKQRLASLLDDQAAQLTVTTFHGLGWMLVREQAERLGLSESIQIADPDRCVEILQAATDSSAKQARQWLNKRETFRQTELESYKAYQSRMREEGLVDFDDLIELPTELLESDASLAQTYRDRYRWVCIDEYQDIDAWQYRLVRALCPEEGNLCAIGDPDQAIYGFRGADVGYFQRFCDDYPGAQTVYLSRNYRSMRTIVDASAQMIRPASLVSDRAFTAVAESADQIEISCCASDKAEAEFVVHTIERMIGGSSYFSLDSGRVQSHEGHDLSFSDFAVLYRTDAQAGLLAEALDRSGMPFQKRSHATLIDQPAIQALLETLGEQELSTPMDQRLVVGAASIREAHPEIDLVLPVLTPIAKRADDLSAFVSELTLGVDADLWNPKADRISLLTLHASKGLEFPVVFIVGCEDGIVPMKFGPDDLSEEDLAEERRLFFVGMTRAEQHLVLTHARKRQWRGKVRETEVSPFLADIEKRLLAIKEHKAVRRKPLADTSQMALFGDME